MCTWVFIIASWKNTSYNSIWSYADFIVTFWVFVSNTWDLLGKAIEIFKFVTNTKISTINTNYGNLPSVLLFYAKALQKSVKVIRFYTPGHEQHLFIGVSFSGHAR